MSYGNNRCVRINVPGKIIFGEGKFWEKQEHIYSEHINTPLSKILQGYNYETKSAALLK